MSYRALKECHSCGKEAELVELTAEYIQRVRPPSVTLVCAKCREWYRSAARLETRYSTGIAFRDFVIMTSAALLVLILLSNVIWSLRYPLPLAASQIVFLVTVATSLTGVKMVYSELSGRYSFTHNLAWSLHSRYTMLSISIAVSGLLASLFPLVFA